MRTILVRKSLTAGCGQTTLGVFLGNLARFLVAFFFAVFFLAVFLVVFFLAIFFTAFLADFFVVFFVADFAMRNNAARQRVSLLRRLHGPGDGDLQHLDEQLLCVGAIG